MSEPAQKCQNNAIFKQRYTTELFIVFKMAYYAISAKGEIWIFQIFSKKNLLTEIKIFCLKREE